MRNGSVIDLQITAGEIRAQVMGSSLYTVAVTVTACPAKHWRAIGPIARGQSIRSWNSCRAALDSRDGAHLPTWHGLFPVPKEIRFSCSCPDWASMCKHVCRTLRCRRAARQQPELLFTLRRVEANDLIRQAGAGLPNHTKRPKGARRRNGWHRDGRRLPHFEARYRT
ncbi:conserved protein of unknown function (plasmid) [Cupriavidus taiwanensis]|nr:conserved protein of unknown function [Cupriavidus taiwanensis]